MKENRKNILILVGAVVLFLAMELPYIVDVRPVMVDESWYGNTAYNLAHGQGFANTIVGNGGNANFVAPAIMAGMMLIFGDNLLAIRLAAVLCGVLTLIVLHLIMNHINSTSKSRIVCYILFCGITILNSVFRYGRPEFAALLFMALGIYAYLRYYDNKTWGNMILMSIATFLATCSHPYVILLFALMGCWLLINLLSKHNTSVQLWLQLLLLLLSAIAALTIISIVGTKYNLVNSSAGHTILDSNRLGGTDILGSIGLYINEVFFSKHALTTVPGIALVLWTILKSQSRSMQSIAAIIAIYMVLFPILFAQDKNMIGNAADYYVLILVMLVVNLFNQVDLSNMTSQWKTCVYGLALCYCILHFGITLYFNYHVRFEKANSVLKKEISSIIPDDALVFGPIRQWPSKMKSHYYSDHARYNSLPSSYEYIITNEQDKKSYAIYEYIMKDIAKYEIVYQRKTKQYGEVTIYKLIDK